MLIKDLPKSIKATRIIRKGLAVEDIPDMMKGLREQLDKTGFKDKKIIDKGNVIAIEGSNQTILKPIRNRVTKGTLLFRSNTTIFVEEGGRECYGERVLKKDLTEHGFIKAYSENNVVEYVFETPIFPAK